MDAFTLRALLTLDKKGYEEGLTDAEKSAKNLGTKIQGALNTAGKIAGAVVAAGAAGVAAITKKAFDSYKDYEQLVGGVETLYKKSAKQVQQYANDAYKTAGMSANDYMSTVTSFAASLIQSLDGDTAKAAKVADMAIRDMSDNANKMGTDIASIQTAYQGFAKQNFSMLDNLKLGYGGTREEMQRLLKDAQKISGYKYDIGNLNDIYKAIHVIQGELQITGTTAKEAMSTIEGSANATKAAWKNVLTAIAGGGNLKAALKQLETSIFGDSRGGGLLNNVIPRIKYIMEGIAEFIGRAGEIIKRRLPQLLDSLQPAIESMVSAIGKMIEVLIPTLMPIFIKIGTSFVSGVVKGLGNFGPIGKAITAFFGLLIGAKIISGISNLINSLSALKNAFQMLNLQGIQSVFTGIKSFALYLASNPMILVIMGIVAAIAAAVAAIVSNWDAIKSSTTSAWASMSKTIQDGQRIWSQSFTAITKVASSAWKAITKTAGEAYKVLRNDAKEAFEGLKETISSSLDNLGRNVKSAFATLGSSIGSVWRDIKTTTSQTVRDLSGTVTSSFNNLKTSAITIWQKIGQGMSSPIEAARQVLQANIGGIRNVFQGFNAFFNSIGQAMKAVGRAITLPIETAYRVVKGLLDSIYNFSKGFKSAIGKIGSGISSAFSKITSGWHADAMEEGMVFTRPTIFGYANGQFQGAGEAGAEGLIGIRSMRNIIENSVANSIGKYSGSSGNVINIYGAVGQDVREIADAVADVLQIDVDRRRAAWA